ncbi:translocon-associated protein subunit beta-like [Ciona intestinalis]
MKYCVLVLFLSCFCVVASEESSAKLILTKNILNSIITQGNDLAIEYNMYNIGDGVATDVELADSTLHDTDFELISGKMSVKWDRIQPGTNVTHVVVVRPLKSGAQNFTSAVVQYVASEDSEPKFGFSSEIGEVEILSLKEYNRLYAPHVVEWGMFGIWTIPSLLLPYMLYYNSKTKYTVKSKKN